MVTEITPDHYRLTEGESGDKAGYDQYHSDDREPTRGDNRKHEPVSDFHLVVQRVSDRYESVIGENRQVERLHGEAGVAEEQEGQAVVVGDEVMVEQEDVQDLRHQSRVTEQVRKGQVKNDDILWSSQIAIQTYYSHDCSVCQHGEDIHKTQKDVIILNMRYSDKSADCEIRRTHKGDVLPESRVEKLHCERWSEVKKS